MCQFEFRYIHALQAWSRFTGRAVVWWTRALRSYSLDHIHMTLLVSFLVERLSILRVPVSCYFSAGHCICVHIYTMHYRAPLSFPLGRPFSSDVSDTLSCRRWSWQCETVVHEDGSLLRMYCRRHSISPCDYFSVHPSSYLSALEETGKAC